MQSIESNIEKAIKSKSKGSLLLPDDFRLLGSSEAIRKALQRLQEKQIIKRVAQGIYVRPKTNKYIGEVLPSAEEVAIAIAKRDKTRTVPTGTYALYALGLSTQIPIKIVLLTDGSPRTIIVGKRTIKFKKTTPKNLLAKGKISSLVIQALKEIGIDKQTLDEELKIIELLKEENPNYLLYDISLAPVWIQKIMKKAL
jgi:DNA-binding GntR family transcriptional regulator